MTFTEVTKARRGLSRDMESDYRWLRQSLDRVLGGWVPSAYSF